MLFCRCVCSLTGLGIYAGKDSVSRLQINPYSYLMGLWVSPLQFHDLHFADLWESLSFSCSYCALLGVTFRKCLNILNSLGCCYFTCLFIYLGIFCWRHAEVSIPLSQHSHLHFFFLFLPEMQTGRTRLGWSQWLLPYRNSPRLPVWRRLGGWGLSVPSAWSSQAAAQMGALTAAPVNIAFI